MAVTSLGERKARRIRFHNRPSEMPSDAVMSETLLPAFSFSTQLRDCTIARINAWLGTVRQNELETGRAVS